MGNLHHGSGRVLSGEARIKMPRLFYYQHYYCAWKPASDKTKMPSKGGVGVKVGELLVYNRN